MGSQPQPAHALGPLLAVAGEGRGGPRGPAQQHLGHHASVAQRIETPWPMMGSFHPAASPTKTTPSSAIRSHQERHRVAGARPGGGGAGYGVGIGSDRSRQAVRNSCWHPAPVNRPLWSSDHAGRPAPCRSGGGRPGSRRRPRCRWRRGGTAMPVRARASPRPCWPGETPPGRSRPGVGCPTGGRRRQPEVGVRSIATPPTW